jgi:hypothetical protein
MTGRSFARAMVGLLAVLLCVLAAGAQTAPLAPGTVGSVQLYNGGTCPSDFWSPGPSNPPVCYNAIMTCANETTTPNLNFIYSYVTPSPTLKGTVVLLTGGGGMLADVHYLDRFARDYYYANYEVVQIAWEMTNWEQTVSDGVHPPPGILTAACRPAGFLNYVLNTPLLNARSVNPFNGLCAHALSAGAGAVGYSLVWYGDQNLNYLSTDYDNVELTSGPVFGDIKLGCQFPPPASPYTVICGAGQYGCSSGTTAWSNNPAYIGTDLRWVQGWTGNLTPACNNGSQSTAANDPSWKAMSIVTGTGGNFSYPNLGMAGWLCASSVPCNPYQCPNNSAAQGEQFFNQFTSKAQVAGYNLTGIALCKDAEGVEDGYDPDNCTVGVNCPTGEAAIVAHMQQQCKHPTPH